MNISPAVIGNSKAKEISPPQLLKKSMMLSPHAQGEQSAI
jgi:hypothetical protein